MRSKKSISFNNWATPDSKGSDVSAKFMEWQSYRAGALARWEETEAYIYATDTLSLPGGNNFEHTTHIPLVHEIRDDLISIMYGTILPHDDFLGWQPFDKESSTKDKRLKATAYLKNRHALNGFRKSLDKLITDVIDYGNCFVQVQYVDNTSEYDGEIIEGYVGPVLKRFSPYDVVMDATADSFEQAPKIIRTLLSMGEFIRMAENKEGWDQEAVQHIKEKRGTYGTVDFSDAHKNKQFVPDGFGNIEQYYASGMVELLWFYGDVFDEYTGEVHRDRCVVVADRCTALIDYHCPEPNIYHGTWKPKQDNLWAQGALDQIIGINYQINHRENSLSTSIDRFMYPDRLFMGDCEVIYNPETGQTDIMAPEGGGVRDITPDSTVLSYDQQIQKLTMNARSAVGLPPTLQGFRTPGEKTAFEVQSLNDGAFRSFLHKAERFEMNVLEPAVNAELRIGRDKLNSPMQVQAVTDDGMQRFITITDADLKSNGKLVPYGARRFARQNQQMQMLNMLANSNLGQIIAPHLKTFALAQVVETLGGMEEFKMFDENAAIEEQFKQQQLMQTAEQMQVQGLSEPTLEEALQDAEE